MTKAILTTTNSLWGVIINPHSANEYRHVINFKDDSVKADFINKNLFGGGDYKQKLVDAPEISISIIDSTKAIFRVNPADYPNEDMISLLNKDFAIISHNGKELFYTLTSKVHGSLIEYSCELDIFFTYNIKDMFNDRPAEIARAMSDRYVVKVAANNKKVITAKHLEKNDGRNINRNNDPIFLPEEIDGISEDSLLPVGKIEPFSYDFRPYMDPSITKTFKNDINKALNGLRFQKINLTLKSDGSEPDLTTSKSYHYRNADDQLKCGLKKFIPNTYYAKNNEDLPQGFDNNSIIESNIMTVIGLADSAKDSTVEIYLVGGGDEPKLKMDYIDNPPVDCTSIVKLGPATIVADNPNVIDGSLTPVPGSFLADLITDTDNFIIGFKNGKVQILVRIDAKWGLESKYVLETDQKSAYYGTNYALIGLNVVTDKAHEYSSEVKPFDESVFHINTGNQDNFKRDAAFDPKYELKAYNAPYRMFKVGSSTENKMAIKPQLFTNNDKIKCKISNNHMVENWGYALYMKNYKNIFMKSEYVNPEANIHFEDRANYTMLTTKNGFLEFMARNRAQQNQALNSKAASAAAGVGGAILGATAGIVTGSPLAAIGSLFGGGSGLMSSINGIKQQFAMQKDLMSSPERLSNSGTTLIKDFLQKDMRTHLQEYRINPFMQRVIAEHFYIYGYSYNGKLHDINELIETRVTFNFLKVSGAFENCKLQASAEIKQMINDTLENGVHIWHCNDASKFKGIKNFKVANAELEVVNAIESGAL